MVKKEKCKILAYIHCRKCMFELPKSMSPQQFAQLEVGYTKQGFQVWCKRHDCSVCVEDFCDER
jgi:hypothetical protein